MDESINLNEFKCIIDDQTGKLLKIPFCNYQRNMTLVRCLLYAKKANKVLIGTNQGLYICNPETFEKENELDPASKDGWSYDLINSTDSYFLYERKDGTILTSSRNSKMKIYDLFKLECIKEIIIDSKYHYMVYDGTELSNGNLVAAIGECIQIYDGKNYELIKNIKEYQSTVHAICSLKNNKFATASYEDSRLIFWKNDFGNYIKEYCINEIKIGSNKVLFFDENKNAIIVGIQNNILIIDGDKYNILNKITIDKSEFSYAKCLLSLKDESFIVAGANGNIFEYDNKYNLHSKLKNCIGDFHPLLNSITDITFCNNCLWVAYNSHFIGIFKKSKEETKVSKYNRYEYDSDSD